jgi:putative aldouronate transport system substrate-binding protein
MNKSMKILSLLLAVSLLSATMTACAPKGAGGSSDAVSSDSQGIDNSGTSNGSDNNNSNANTTSGVTSSGSKSGNAVSNSGSTSNFIEDTNNPKIVKSKVTINMFVPKSPIQPSWDTMVLFKEIEKRTNIKMSFEQVPLSSYPEKRSLKWEDKRNPTDAFFLANNMDEIVLYAARGALTPLNSLIDKYAPNYKKWLAKYPQIKKITTLSDGNIYSFASVDTVGGQAAKQYINKKWLDDLGLKVPTTTEEFYTVLKAFKTQNPNGKNGNDEIPFSYIGADQSRNFLISCFGYVGTGMELDSRTGKMVWVPSTNNYREYVKFANRLYKEGLIDPYVFSNQSADLVVKGKSNQLGCFSTAGAFLVVGTALDNDYTSFGPLTSPINSKKMWYQFGRQFEPTIMIIPKTSKYSKELVRWIDVMYDEKTVPLQSNGMENIDWKWNDTAKTAWTFLVPNGMEREQFRATLTYQAGLGGAVLSNGFALKDSSPETLKINKEISIYRPYMREVFPILQYTSNEIKAINDLEAQLNNYMSTTEANFIKGIKDPNDNATWNDHLNTLNKINYKKLVTTYQAAYDRQK